MPELPEVQTVVNDLLSLDIVGQKIKRVYVIWRRSVNSLSDRALNRYLAGKAISRIVRRGKYIVFHLDGEGLLSMHLRMSGRLRYVPGGSILKKHEQAAIRLANGFDLRFYDPRKFGRIFMGEEASRRIEQLGAEPLDRSFTLLRFEQLLLSRRRMIKPLFLDQSVISGLGNIYTDEALWQAGIHPLRLSSTLGPQERKDLFRSVRSVLRRGIRHFGTSLGEGEANFISANKRKGSNLLNLKVYGRKGAPCARCKDVIERLRVAQRSTYVCLNCQR